MTLQKKKSKRFDLELKVVEALRTRLAKEGGITRLHMKDDGCYIDVAESVGGKFLLTFPPHYGTYGNPMPYNRLTNGLTDLMRL